MRVFLPLPSTIRRFFERLETQLGVGRGVGRGVLSLGWWGWVSWSWGAGRGVLGLGGREGCLRVWGGVSWGLGGGGVMGLGALLSGMGDFPLYLIKLQA